MSKIGFIGKKVKELEDNIVFRHRLFKDFNNTKIFTFDDIIKDCAEWFVVALKDDVVIIADEKTVKEWNLL